MQQAQQPASKASCMEGCPCMPCLALQPTSLVFQACGYVLRHTAVYSMLMDRGLVL